MASGEKTKELWKDPEYRARMLPNLLKINHARRKKPSSVTRAEFLRAVKHRNRVYINNIKARRPCSDCGISYPPVVMDFDHIGTEPKYANVSQLVNFSKKIIDREIAKCELVCANCHRLRTASRKTLVPPPDSAIIASL